MNPEDWKRGQRLRCIDPDAHGVLQLGQEYTFLERHGEFITVEDCPYDFFATRFKPVVRVKAVCVPSLEVALRRSVAAFNSMTQEQQAAHLDAQRASWVRGQTGWD